MCKYFLISFTFTKQEKLKSRKKIDLLFSKGKSFSVFPFKIIYLIDDDTENLQAGFAVSSSKFKRAVDRNRIKRLMRECYRLQKQELTECATRNSCSVFFIYTGNVLPDYHEIFPKMGTALHKLSKVLNEDTTLHT